MFYTNLDKGICSTVVLYYCVVLYYSTCMCKLNILSFVNKKCTFYFIKRDRLVTVWFQNIPTSILCLSNYENKHLYKLDQYYFPTDEND